MKPTDLTKEQISKIANFCVEQIIPNSHNFNDRILEGVRSFKDNPNEMAVMIETIEKYLASMNRTSPLLNICSLKIAVCECFMTRGYWDYPELTHRHHYSNTNMPPKHQWISEKRIPNSDEIFSMIHNETFDRQDLNYNFPEQLIMDLISDEDLDVFLCNELNIDLSKDTISRLIKVSRNNLLIHSGDGLAMDKALTEIMIWLRQWHWEYNPRPYQPYRNGNNLYVLGQGTGICLFPSPKRKDKGFLQIQLEEVEGEWFIKGTVKAHKPYEGIRIMEDSILCATVAYKYLKEFATEEDFLSDRPNYCLPWLDK